MRRLAPADNGAAHEMGGMVTAGRVVPGAADEVASVRGECVAGLNRPARNADLAVRPVDLNLGLLLEKREQLRVPGRQREHPPARRAAARNLAHDPHEVAEAELVAAEPTRLERAVEARIDECSVGLVEKTTRRLGLGLPLPKRRAQRLRAREHLRRRQLPLGRDDPVRAHAREINHQDFDRQELNE